MAIIPFLIIFSLLVFVHEGGHFLVAKLFGVGVEEFGFGYPPKILGKKIGKTIYSMNLIPFGGFARIKGADTADSLAGEPDSFATQAKFKRALILCGGIFGNFILAWLIFTLLLIIGNPVPANKVLVEEVADGSPAASAGIAAGDYILSFGGGAVETADALVDLIDKNANRPSLMEIERYGKTLSITATPAAGLGSDSGGQLGIVVSTAVKYERSSILRAPFAAFGELVGLSWQMVRLFEQLVIDLFRGEAVEVGGPVAILALTGTYVTYGIRIFLQFIALLSLNLAIVNLLPIPALDGGRLLFIWYEAVLGKRPSYKIERRINSIGFVLLVILMTLITIKDLRTFF